MNLIRSSGRTHRRRRARLTAASVAVVVATAGAAAGCSSGSEPQAAAATSTVRQTTSSTIASTTTRETSSKPPTTSGSTPADDDGAPVYADPDADIHTADGKEFVVRLPPPANAQAWAFDADECINVKDLGRKVAPDGSTHWRFRWVVDGACHLGFYDAEAPDVSAPHDVQFNATNF